MRYNVGIEWILIEQARLGCRPDGGGRSDPHPDADIVAAALTVLPEAYGGAGMAITIAECARTGRMPDCMPNAVARCAPRGWRRHKTGTYAEREYWTGPGRWPSTWLSDKYGYVCPVTYTGTAVDVGRARRAYLQWWSALLELRHCLSIGRSLSAFRLTDAIRGASLGKIKLDLIPNLLTSCLRTELRPKLRPSLGRFVWERHDLDLREHRKASASVGRRAGQQIPYALSRALNDTARDVIEAERLHMVSVFDRPTRWTLNAFRVERSSKSNLVATVERKSAVGRRFYLEVQAEGGARPQTGLERAMGYRLKYAGQIVAVTPAAGMRLTAAGNMSPRW